MSIIKFLIEEYKYYKELKKFQKDYDLHPERFSGYKFSWNYDEETKTYKETVTHIIGEKEN